MGLGKMGPKLRTRIILSATIKFLFNDCQAKTIGFRVPTITLGHLHCWCLVAQVIHLYNLLL